MNNQMQMIINNALNNSQMMQNPMFANAVNMYRRGDVQGLKNMAENVCRENGTSVNDVSNRIKQQFGL